MNMSVITTDAVVFNGLFCFMPKVKTVSFVKTNGWVKKSVRLSIGQDSVFLSTTQHQEPSPGNAIHYGCHAKAVEGAGVRVCIQCQPAKDC